VFFSAGKSFYHDSFSFKTILALTKYNQSLACVQDLWRRLAEEGVSLFLSPLASTTRGLASKLINPPTAQMPRLIIGDRRYGG